MGGSRGRGGEVEGWKGAGPARRPGAGRAERAQRASRGDRPWATAMAGGRGHGRPADGDPLGVTLGGHFGIIFWAPLA